MYNTKKTYFSQVLLALKLFFPYIIYLKKGANVNILEAELPEYSLIYLINKITGRVESSSKNEIIFYSTLTFKRYSIDSNFILKDLLTLEEEKTKPEDWSTLNKRKLEKDFIKKWRV